MRRKVTSKPASKSISAVDSKEGFTLIEVMLVLAITGLMLVGLIGGSYTSIARQRYLDSLNSFAEYLSRIYSEVISPESFGKGDSDSETGNRAILGKILVFGHQYDDSTEDTRSVYSATLVGSADISISSNQTFLEEFVSEAADVQLFCGSTDPEQQTTVSRYTPLWEASLMQTAPDQNEPFKGVIIISRTPTSGTVHTYFAPYTPEASKLDLNLRDQCTPDDQRANADFIEVLKEIRELYRRNPGQSHNEDRFFADADHQVKICVKPGDGSALARQVNLAIDGRNTSAINILTEEESACR